MNGLPAEFEKRMREMLGKSMKTMRKVLRKRADTGFALTG